MTMYVHRPWLSVAFAPTILLLLLQASLSLQRTVRCGPPKLPMGPDEPDPADCRFLLAHLPSNPLTPDPDTSPPFSRSLPFHPRAYISYASCAAELAWYVVPGAAAQVPAVHSAPPVIELYELMRDGGFAVVDVCLESGQYIAGAAEGTLRGDLGWQIRIEAAAVDTWWRNSVVRLRRAMRGAMGKMAPLPDPWGYAVLEL